MAGEGTVKAKKITIYLHMQPDRLHCQENKEYTADVVNKLGKQRVDKIYDLADIYHCDNIDRVSEDFIEEAGIQEGNFNNVGDCKYSIPSHWDIGKVYSG